MNHAKALGIVVAYDIYLECCEGQLDSEWKRTPVSFWEFRECLSRQMLSYHPSNMNYLGDEKMRVVTKTTKKRRIQSIQSKKLTKELITEAQTIPHGEVGRRLVASVNEFQEHMCRMSKVKNSLVCVVCGDPCYTLCTCCPGNPAMHNKPSRGDFRGRMCSYIYHDTYQFGLCRCDAPVKKEWVPPRQSRIDEHKIIVQQLLDQND